MNYVKTSNGTIVSYPYNKNNIRSENPKVSFPSEIPDSILADYGIFPVANTSPPSVSIYQSVKENTPVLDGGVWRQSWVVVNASVPETITPRQCRLVLYQQGLLGQVEQIMAQSTDDVRITWEYALEFRRDDPLLNQLGANLGLTKEQIDQFFIAAAQL